MLYPKTCVTDNMSDSLSVLITAFHDRPLNLPKSTTAVAYPGGFSGCPETPPPGHDFFLIRGFTYLHAPTFTSHLNLRLLETPLETNSGYATARAHKTRTLHTHTLAATFTDDFCACQLSPFTDFRLICSVSVECNTSLKFRHF